MIKLFNSAYEWNLFKGDLRDLLISMKKIACNDDAFYEEEKQGALKAQAEAEEARKRSIPGLLTPIQLQQGFASNQ